MSVIASEKANRLSFPVSQRSSRACRIVSIDGLAKDGQFYITVSDAAIGRVVTPKSFLTKKGKAAPELKVGACILFKEQSGSGLIKRATTSSFKAAAIASYNDLTAIFTPEQEKEWFAEGLLTN
jgi:hypothetical protein